jgi:peptide/nickel transport system substrate-binding protein
MAMNRLSRWVLAGGALTCALAAAPAMAQKSADTLRVAWRDQIADVDPYFNSLRTGLVVAHQAMDGLVYRDPNDFSMKPLLATSWKWIDDTTIEFELRRGVTFPNGDPFTAADVLYTVSVLTDPKAGLSVPSNFAWLAGAEPVDDFHVRLKLKSAFPAALQYVAFVMPIYPKAYRERLGHAGFSKAPMGIGPYKITRVDNVSEIDLERFDGYYDGSPKGKPPIRKLVIREVNDATNELTALLGGQADWIWQFNPDQFDSIARVPTLTAVRHESMRLALMNLDAAGRSGANNPLTNVLVRRAIFHAIDRETFARQLVQGGARVPDGPCYFTQFGCDAAAEVHYGYDPAKAKALLTEAGYPNGFDTEIVNGILPQWAGAVQNYLAAVGIRAKVSTLQATAALGRYEKGDAPLYMTSWGSYSINDVSAILPYWFNANVDDPAQDKEVTALLKQGGSVVDPEERKKAYSAALHRVTDQAYILPLSTYVTTYGISRQLNFTAYADEMPRFYESSWK